MFDLIPWKRRNPESGSVTGPWVFRRGFDDLIGRVFGEEPFLWHGKFGRIFTPAVDISENDNEITVTAEIPGIEKNDLEVSVSGDTLTIKGEKKAEHEEKSENFHRLERSHGSFARSFSLPCEIQQDRVDRSFKNGVLTLKLPKTEECKSRSVKIPVQ